MSDCPNIEELVTPSGAGSDTAAHVEGCPACSALVALATFRGIAARISDAPAVCAAFEPAIAALVDGTLGAERLAELVAHLGRCGACNDLAARLSLFRGELDDVPEPEIEAKWSEPTIAQAIGAGEVIEVAPRPAPSKWKSGSRWQRAAPWAAAVGCGIGIGLIGAAMIFTRPPERIASVPSPSTSTTAALATTSSASSLPGGALSLEAKIESLERRARDAEERAELAERFARAAQRRLEALEAEATSAKPGPSGRPPAPVDPGPHPKVATLTITCRPTCEVFDNGIRIGAPSIFEHPLAPGEHRLVIKNGEVEKRLTLTLRAGDRIVQQFDMTEYR